MRRSFLTRITKGTSLSFSTFRKPAPVNSQSATNSVCNEGSHLPRLHNLEKPIQQIGVFFGTGSAAVTQSGSRDWKGDSVLCNPNHGYVYRRLTEVPPGSVQNCRIERTGRNEVQEKPPERLVAKGKLGEKPLEAPVGQVDLALRLPRVGQLGKIRGRLHRKRSR